MRYKIYFELRQTVNRKLYPSRDECNEEDKVEK